LDDLCKKRDDPERVIGAWRQKRESKGMLVGNHGMQKNRQIPDDRRCTKDKCWDQSRNSRGIPTNLEGRGKFLRFGLYRSKEHMRGWGKLVTFN